MLIWNFSNYPSIYVFQKPTVTLEAVAFGMPGSHNNRNVLDTSPLFSNTLNGQGPKCEYKINGNNYQYHEGYYLANGIYPYWATFVKKICSLWELNKDIL
jgi:hypothetical protein